MDKHAPGGEVFVCGRRGSGRSGGGGDGGGGGVVDRKSVV